MPEQIQIFIVSNDGTKHNIEDCLPYFLTTNFILNRKRVIKNRFLINNVMRRAKMKHIFKSVKWNLTGYVL